MPGADQYALILSLRTEALADALVRVLNDPMTCDPTSSQFLPRRLDIPEPRVLLWWDEPALALDQAGNAVLSLSLAGGVRQAGPIAATARIATVDGTVRARYTPALDTAAGALRLTLDLEALDLTGVRVHYAGSNPLPLLDVAGGRMPVVAALVKDAAAALAAQPLLSDFMGNVGRRPLSYVPGAFILPEQPDAATMHVYGPKAGGALAIGVGLVATGPDALPPVNLLERYVESNAAIALSGTYLNSRLADLLAGNLIKRTLTDSSGAELAGLDSLQVALDDGRLVLHGHMTHGTAGANLHVLLRLALDETTKLVSVAIEQVTVELDTVRAGSGGILADMEAQNTLNAVPRRLSRAFWPEVVAALLGGRAGNDGGVDLTQRFVVPGTSVAVDAPAVALEVTGDSLTLFTAIRTDARFVPEPPQRAPSVAIAQRRIPTQAAPHAPVEALVEAQVTSASYAPYDFAWETDPPQPALDTHQPGLPVRGTPTGMAGDPEGIARVRVTLIDAFGQVAHNDAQVLAHPARHQRQQKQPPAHPRPRSLLRILLPAALALILVAASVAVVLPHIGPGSNTALATPIVNVLPMTAYNQTCEPAVSTLDPIPVTLDNSAGGVAVAWQAAVSGNVPGGTELWATVTSASGTMPARSTATFTITPAADLCSQLRGAAAQQVFAVTLTYSAMAHALRGTGSLAAAYASDAPAIAASSRQVTITDTISSVNFSAYVVLPDGLNTTTISASCDARFVLRPAEFILVLDNTQSTAAASWQISIPDNAAAAPPETALATPTPAPSATPFSPEPWAQAILTSGTLAAGQHSRVAIVPVKDLCARLGPGTTPIPLRVLVTLEDGSTIPITDFVTPVAPVINFAVTVIDKAATSFTSIAQNCASLTPFTVALDNRESNVPVNWQVSITDSVYSSGVPTPTPGPAEVWATADITSGTVAPGVNGTASMTITPASDLCQSLPTSTQTYTYPYTVVVSYADGQKVTITDEITKYGIPA